MASEFSREFFSANRIVKADLHCARQPREQDLDKIKAELKSLYDATEVLLDVSVDESLLSGYVLQVGDRVFDNSGRHALDQMTGDKPDLATLKTRVEDYKPAANTAEGGTVVSAADGIVTVEGMDRADLLLNGLHVIGLVIVAHMQNFRRKGFLIAQDDIIQRAVAFARIMVAGNIHCVHPATFLFQNVAKNGPGQVHV